MPMKKILFIIPYIPYPLVSGGNQAFYHMIEYIRYEMEVSILLFPQSKSEKGNIDNLCQIWTNVNFYIFEEKIYIQSYFIVLLLQSVQFALIAVLQKVIWDNMQTATTAKCKRYRLLQFLIFTSLYLLDNLIRSKIDQRIHY